MTRNMPENYYTDKIFDKTDFRSAPLAMGEYDGCRFAGCNFEEEHLSAIRFTDCEFEDCNLTNAQVNETALNEVSFLNCKLVGIHFYKCGGLLFSATFMGCQLNLASFYGMNLSNVTFKDCKLIEVDFTEANLSGLVLDACDLNRAIFSDTNLEKADFRTAFNFNIDPERNRLKQAKFSMQNVSGLLSKYGVVIDEGL